MATDDQTSEGPETDAEDRETLVRRLFERDFERHREIYETLEDE